MNEVVDEIRSNLWDSKPIETDPFKHTLQLHRSLASARLDLSRLVNSVTNSEVRQELKDAAINVVKLSTEIALNSPSFRDRVSSTPIAEFLSNGTLSTDPERVRAIVPDNQRGNFDEKYTETMRLRCKWLSLSLGETLIEEGLFSEAHAHLDAGNHLDHFFLSTLVEGQEIIIDPSISQFVKGHSHVFVGTRDQIRDIVVNQTGTNKPYKIVNSGLTDKVDDSQGTENMYEVIWSERYWGDKFPIRKG